MPSRLTLLVLTSQLFMDQQERVRFIQAVVGQGRASIPRVWLRRADGSSIPMGAEGSLVQEPEGYSLRLVFTAPDSQPGERGEPAAEAPAVPGERPGGGKTPPTALGPGGGAPAPGGAGLGGAAPAGLTGSPVLSPELRKRVFEQLSVPDIGRTADRFGRFLDWVLARRTPLLVAGAEGSGSTFLVDVIHDARFPRGGALSRCDAELTGDSGLLSTLDRFLAAATPGIGLVLRRADAASPETQDRLVEIAMRLGAAAGFCLYATSRPGSPIVRRFSEEVGGDVFTIPSLAERPQDIVPAMSRILRRPRPGARLFQTIHPDAARLLELYAWPGNIDEMREIAESARLLSGGSELRIEDLPARVAAQPLAPASGHRYLRRLPAGIRGRRGRPVKHLDGDQIRSALETSGGNRTRAAEMLGVSRTTLWRKIVELGPELAESEDPAGSPSKRPALSEPRSEGDRD